MDREKKKDCSQPAIKIHHGSVSGRAPPACVWALRAEREPALGALRVKRKPRLETLRRVLASCVPARSGRAKARRAKARDCGRAPENVTHSPKVRRLVKVIGIIAEDLKASQSSQEARTD